MSSSPGDVDAGINIKNAVTVVLKTYENAAKFLAEVDGFAADEGLAPVTPGFFLRWRSDTDCRAWLITSFIKLFQNRDDSPHAGIDGLRQGIVYGIEIALWETTGAVIVLSRFSYDPELRLWPHLPSWGDHWPGPVVRLCHLPSKRQGRPRRE